jgi:hypothetical protein
MEEGKLLLIGWSALGGFIGALIGVLCMWILETDRVKNMENKLNKEE